MTLATASSPWNAHTMAQKIGAAVKSQHSGLQSPKKLESDVINVWRLSHAILLMRTILNCSSNAILHLPRASHHTGNWDQTRHYNLVSMMIAQRFLLSLHPCLIPRPQASACAVPGISFKPLTSPGEWLVVSRSQLRPCFVKLTACCITVWMLGYCFCCLPGCRLHICCSMFLASFPRNWQCSGPRGKSSGVCSVKFFPSKEA